MPSMLTETSAPIDPAEETPTPIDPVEETPAPIAQPASPPHTIHEPPSLERRRRGTPIPVGAFQQENWDDPPTSEALQIEFEALDNALNHEAEERAEEPESPGQLCEEVARLATTAPPRENCTWEELQLVATVCKESAHTSGFSEGFREVQRVQREKCRQKLCQALENESRMVHDLLSANQKPAIDEWRGYTVPEMGMALGLYVNNSETYKKWRNELESTLENPDEIWPVAANTYEGLAEDVHAYKNWIAK
ncbi:hypothetical protein DMENIID0001_069760 [Sergentomyia squamirostris]